jgi:fatty acid desaturase
MKPRYAADYRTILWLFLAGVNVCAIWALPAWRGYLLPIACYFSLAAGVIAHNHNHSPTFKSRRANDFLNYVATLYYGFAAFNWIPTHNLNHHKFQNAPGDATITWRFSKRHNLLVMLVYPFVSMYYQLPLIDAYIKEARTKRPQQYRSIMIQLVICWGLPLALTFVDWRATVASIWIPRFFSLWTIIYFNYDQHAHCDPYSKWNHSRSFKGKALNFLLFNNGLHTVHHIKAGAHWSVLPKMHAEIEHNIDPSLNIANFWGWFFKVYFLSLINPKYGTQQIGRPAYEPPGADAEPLPSAIEGEPEAA